MVIEDSWESSDSQILIFVLPRSDLLQDCKVQLCHIWEVADGISFPFLNCSFRLAIFQNRLSFWKENFSLKKTLWKAVHAAFISDPLGLREHFETQMRQKSSEIWKAHRFCSWNSPTLLWNKHKLNISWWTRLKKANEKLATAARIQSH